MFPGMQLRSAGKLLEQGRFGRPALLFLIFKWSVSVKLLAAAQGRCQACLGLLWTCLKIRAKAGDLLLKDLGAQLWVGRGDGCRKSENTHLKIYIFTSAFPNLEVQAPFLTANIEMLVCEISPAVGNVG